MAGMGPMGPMGNPMGPAYMPVPGAPQQHMGYPGGGGWQAPPMYQPPMQPAPHAPYPHQQQQYAAHGQHHQPLPPHAIPPPSIQPQPQGFYSPRHHSLPAQISHAFSRSPRPPRYSDPHQHLPAERDLGDPTGGAAHYGPPPRHASDRSKVHFDPAPSRHHKKRYQASEASMVERDRVKAAAEEAEAAAAIGMPGHPNPSGSGSRRGQKQEQRLYGYNPNSIPAPSPTMSQKRRWWMSRTMHPGYAAAATHEDDERDYQRHQQQAEARATGEAATGSKGTGDSKSFFSERGWNKWSRQERQQDRRASRMGVGPWYG